MKNKRVTGFYWVCTYGPSGVKDKQEHWEPASWDLHAQYWLTIGEDVPAFDSDFDEIDERQICRAV